MDFYSPLRYPGGKGKVANYFKQVFKDNLLYDGVYVEPYAGGASVALSLLFNEYASKIVINDKDLSIYAFWYAVLNHNDEFCDLILDTPVTMDVWYNQKEIQNNKVSANLFELGFSTFFLNRTNRSGIINAGVIGGKGQNGDYKIDARFNKIDLINRIKRIGNHRDKIELHNLDAVQLVKQLRVSLPSKALFYFDPPYYVKGKDLYMNYYELKDHLEIAHEISLIKNQKWIVTYDNIPVICDIYNSYRQFDYLLNYSAAGSSKGNEVMIYSDNIYISDHPSLNKSLIKLV